VIATGSRPRRLSIPGAELDGVLNLQTLAEAESLRQRLQPGRRAVVVGAGFIGLEFASAARTSGSRSWWSMWRSAPSPAGPRRNVRA